MKKSSPIVHIGFPKTGTKWLQKYYFPNLEDCFFINRLDLCKHLIEPDVFTFSHNDCKEYFFREAAGRRIVVSDELLVGGLDIGFGVGEFIHLMASRLKDTFGDPEIVITIRNQIDVATSTYAHYIKTGGTYTPEQFFGIIKRFKHFFKNHHLFSLKLFEYDKLIDYYIKIFGSDNVKVFFYEDFQKDCVDFVNELSRILCVKPTGKLPFDVYENKRPSLISLKIQRTLNRFTEQSTFFKNSLIDIPTLYPRTISITERIDRNMTLNLKPYKLPKKVAEHIAEYYIKSNNNLSNLINPSKLKSLGYPL